MIYDGIKVFAYITQGTKLLVFTEQGFPEGGIQVPAGSPEGNETLEEAVLREAREETGLEHFEVKRKLGETIFDNSIYNVDRIDRRVFFHLLCKQDTPERWTHEEQDPSIILEDTPEHILFDFYWHDLSDNTLILQLGHDEYLDVLMHNL
ncbi:MAG: hypothetical protein BAJATHORv1_70113 [Candidatus Thorarchaeota archaeon]|nr:MAG: hypothetical protein BAJATHORv1_70113 [Candidatus Thorarchaeota archaeon]